jgi:hypothetical protein
VLYGDLTYPERTRLEERSSLIVNWCGVVAQRTQKAWDTGISTRVLHKVLANSLIDIHLLSAQNPMDYGIRGVGELVWAPNRFGGLGEIVPVSPYNKLTLSFGLFPSVVELFGLGVYRKYGFKGVKKTGDEHRLLFANDIERKQRMKSPVEPQEQDYWAILAGIYSSLRDEERDALASCRSRVFTLYSLLFQFLHWRRDMRFALERVIAGDLGLSARSFTDARTSKSQFLRKAGYWRGIKKYHAALAAAAEKTEFAGKLPTLNPDDSKFQHKLDVVLRWVPAFEAVHEICKAAYAVCNGGDEDSQALGQAIGYLVEKMPRIGVERSEETRWANVLTARPVQQKQIARRALSLIERYERTFQSDLGMPLPGLETFYRTLLTSSDYPLRSEHFVRGH